MVKFIICFIIKIAGTIGMYQLGWADETFVQTIITYIFLYGFVSVLVNLVAELGILLSLGACIGAIALTDYVITNQTLQMVFGGGIVIVSILYDLCSLISIVKEIKAGVLEQY